jgi:hypothetical protein
MRLIVSIAAMLGLMGVVACHQTPQEAQNTPPIVQSGVCPAADLQNMIGQNADVLKSVRFENAVRIIGPDMAVTMDYSDTRTNFTVDAANIIQSITCG